MFRATKALVPDHSGRKVGQKEIQIGVPEVIDTTPEELLARRLEEAMALAEEYFRRNQES
jgi:hypothetical protein